VSLRATAVVLGVLVVADVTYWAWLLSLPEEQQFASWQDWVNRVSFIAAPALIAAFVITAAAWAFGRGAPHHRATGEGQ
jgi:hypothetical protein